jgi:VWA domain containing CoxE-like protein
MIRVPRVPVRPVPLADARRLWPFARRTSAVRLVLAVVALVLFSIALVATFFLDTRSTSYFAKGGGGIVVADFSKSIDSRSNARTAKVLRSLADSDQRLGLVAFADDAYEMLPPGTRGDEVRNLLRFFESKSGSGLDLLSQTTPWSAAFLGGTSIGEGLQAARQIIERDGIKPASVLLISDLADSTTDLPLMTDEIGRYREDGIRLKVVALFPQQGNLAFFTGITGPGVFLSPGELLDNSKVAEKRSLVGNFPIWLFLAAGLLMVVLAANERLVRRFEWRAQS